MQPSTALGRMSLAEAVRAQFDVVRDLDAPVDARQAAIGAQSPTRTQVTKIASKGDGASRSIEQARACAKAGRPTAL